MSTRPKTEPDLEAEREVDLICYLAPARSALWLHAPGIIVGVVDRLPGGARRQAGLPHGRRPSTSVRRTGPGNRHPGAEHEPEHGVGRIARGDETIRKAPPSPERPSGDCAVGNLDAPDRPSRRHGESQRAELSSTSSADAALAASQADRCASGIAERIVDIVGGYARVRSSPSRRKDRLRRLRQPKADRRTSRAAGPVGHRSSVRSSGASSSARCSCTRSSSGEVMLEQDVAPGGVSCSASRPAGPAPTGSRSRRRTQDDRQAARRNSAAVAGLIGLILGTPRRAPLEPIAARHPPRARFNARRKTRRSRRPGVSTRSGLWERRWPGFPASSTRSSSSMTRRTTAPRRALAPPSATHGSKCSSHDRKPRVGAASHRLRRALEDGSTSSA